MDSMAVETPPLSARSEGVQLILAVFGKEVVIECISVEEASRQAAEWTNHLDIEWMKVRETTATVMQIFTERLLEEGAHKNIIAAVTKFHSHPFC